jgi:hypothetical protein
VSTLKHTSIPRAGQLLMDSIQNQNQNLCASQYACAWGAYTETAELALFACGMRTQEPEPGVRVCVWDNAFHTSGCESESRAPVFCPSCMLVGTDSSMASG